MARRISKRKFDTKRELRATREQLERSLQRLIYEAEATLKNLLEDEHPIDEYLGNTVLDVNSTAAQYNLLKILEDEENKSV